MKRLISLFLVCLCGLPVMAFPSQSPKWSVVVYAGTDEEDLSHHTEPLIQKLVDTQVIPAGVELLMEQDSYGLQPIRRVIKNGKVASISYLPETDSADPQAFSSFLDWAKQNKRGTHTLFLIAGHSWGWKGIIQDFSIPRFPGTDSMMPVRIFSKSLKDSNLSPAVAVFDSCITGNAEFIDEFRGSVPYLVASQRETPYGGLPFHSLFKFLSTRPSPRILAKTIPEIYVRAYARGGEMSAEEGEYDVVTTVSIDMGKWENFVESFKGLTANLRGDNFREALQTSPAKFAAFTDTDFNLDLIEFLKKISAQSLLKKLLYDNSEPHDAIMTFADGNFQVLIQADEILSRDLTPEQFLDNAKQRFFEMNKDFVASPNDLEFKLKTRHSKPFIEIIGTTAKTIHLRPWLPGSREVLVMQNGKERRLIRKRDYSSMVDFPNTSFMLASATTQGAPFVHGIGLNFNPLMDENEERGEDSLTGLRGPYSYEMTSWNQRVGWGDLIHLNR